MQRSQRRRSTTVKGYWSVMCNMQLPAVRHDRSLHLPGWWPPLCASTRMPKTSTSVLEENQHLSEDFQKVFDKNKKFQGPVHILTDLTVPLHHARIVILGFPFFVVLRLECPFSPWVSSSFLFSRTWSPFVSSSVSFRFFSNSFVFLSLRITLSIHRHSAWPVANYLFIFFVPKKMCKSVWFCTPQMNDKNSQLNKKLCPIFICYTILSWA